MSSSLNVRVALSRPNIAPSVYLEEPVYALIDIAPTASPAGGARAPLNIVIVMDSSATMHHFQLTDEERDYWLGLAISRDEMERGEADESEAIYWTGQTLSEMQTVARKPMAIAVEAIKNLLGTLQPRDTVSVVAFADRVHPVFTAADWASFQDQCLQQMDLLREQRLPADIGTGTYMAEALRVASEQLKQAPKENSVNRLIVISDGIVQDADVTMLAVNSLQEEGYAITTIGVGDEFDEEFLTKVADNSRGQYYYAANSIEITEQLQQEMTTLESVTLSDVYVAVRGVNGTMVQDIFQVQPTMALFDELYTESDWLRTRLGDISTASKTGIIVQIAPTTLEPGTQPLAEVQFTWAQSLGADGDGPGTEKVTISANVTSDSSLTEQQNTEVTNLVDRLSIYKYEREAQRAQERGDLERAKEKLGAATKELHEIGEEGLAKDMEEQIAALGQATVDPTRVKRIKATTRRLGSVPPETPPKE